VTANHPNALVDPVVIFHASGRAVRPLAKAPLFEMPLIGTLLRGLGGLPVYRRQDDPTLTHLNESTFDDAIAALARGEAVQIFPEGRSHSEPALAPLRTGAARIALAAEESASWKLGLTIVPMGLTYVRKHRFRGRVVATVGRTFGVTEYRETFVRDPQDAVRQLTEQIRERLEEVTLSVETDADRDLIETAEQLYVREKGWVRWRERDRLGERLPRLQAFARGLAWLQATDPERRKKLTQDVERYRRLLGLFGVSEGDVPPRYRPSRVLLQGAKQLLLLALLAIPAAVGVIAWWLPYLIPGRVAALARPTLDAVATYKLGSALIAFPLMWLLWTLLAAIWLRGPGAALVALALPLTGIAAVRFAERGRVLAEETRVLVRTRRSGAGKDRLLEARRALVAEFDAVADEMERA
jgi:1-acyl-sn-glycerol-3-phosphate acyltransferase